MVTPRYPNDDACWQAVKTRDATADDHFVVAVPSTGQYCLPSAVTILPARDNVEFFRHSAAAEATP